MTIIRPESTRRTADALVSQVVEPGEEILWTGRPHLPTLTGEAERIRVGRSPVASPRYPQTARYACRHGAAHRWSSAECASSSVSWC
jgi:hypothetical protein